MGGEKKLKTFHFHSNGKTVTSFQGLCLLYFIVIAGCKISEGRTAKVPLTLEGDTRIHHSNYIIHQRLVSRSLA